MLGAVLRSAEPSASTPQNPPTFVTANNGAAQSADSAALRLPAELDERLRADAAARGVEANLLLANIVETHLRHSE